MCFSGKFKKVTLPGEHILQHLLCYRTFAVTLLWLHVRCRASTAKYTREEYGLGVGIFFFLDRKNNSRFMCVNALIKEKYF